MYVRGTFGGNIFFLKQMEKSFFLLHSRHLWSRTVPIQTTNIPPLFCLHPHHFLALSLFNCTLMRSICFVFCPSWYVVAYYNGNRNRRLSLKILHYDDDSVCSDLVYLFVIPLCTSGGSYSVPPPPVVTVGICAQASPQAKSKYYMLSRL